MLIDEVWVSAVSHHHQRVSLKGEHCLPWIDRKKQIKVELGCFLLWRSLKEDCPVSHAHFDLLLSFRVLVLVQPSSPRCVFFSPSFSPYCTVGETPKTKFPYLRRTVKLRPGSTWEHGSSSVKSQRRLLPCMWRSKTRVHDRTKKRTPRLLAAAAVPGRASVHDVNGNVGNPSALLIGWSGRKGRY